MVLIWIWKNGTNWLLRTGIWSSCHSSYSLSSIFARISHVLVTECPVVSGTDWNLIETLNSFKMNSLQSSHFSHLNYEVAIKSTFFSLSTLNSVKMVWKWLYGKLRKSIIWEHIFYHGKFSLEEREFYFVWFFAIFFECWKKELSWRVNFWK